MDQTGNIHLRKIKGDIGMRKNHFLWVLLFLMMSSACQNIPTPTLTPTFTPTAPPISPPVIPPSPTAEQSLSNQRITVTHNDISVDILFGKIPDTETIDLLLAYHGTAHKDEKVPQAAQGMLRNVNSILEKDSILVISVLYPEEGLLFGDQIRESEAALLWAMEDAEQMLDVNIDKIFLIGHSQGGYIVARLNTMHKTNGVIANGPGPIDLAIRCQLEEEAIAAGREERPYSVCGILSKEYGGAFENPQPYTARSLLNFTNDHKAKILFVQGMQDKKLQIMLWPTLKENLNQCQNCAEIIFLEFENAGHPALFKEAEAKTALNNFLGE
jgi:hypothetical protein